MTEPREHGPNEILWEGHLQKCRQCRNTPKMPCPYGSGLLRAAALEVADALEPKLMDKLGIR